MPIDLDTLLTIRAPATVPLLGAAPPQPNTFGLDNADAPSQAASTWQLTLSRDRGISAPICAIFMPVPLANAPSGEQTLPPRTVYSRWSSVDGGITARYRLPSSMWRDCEGVLVLLAHLHDKRLIESGPPLAVTTELRPITELSGKAIWEAFGLPMDTVPEQASLQAVLTRKLLENLASARHTPPPHMVRPPDQQALPSSSPGMTQWGASTPTPHQLCFIAASCAYQGGFIDRALKSTSWAAGPADASMQRLIDWRRDSSKPQPTLALLLGDQIYADATAGLFDPRSLDNRYVQPYLDAQQSRFLGEALSGIEIHTMIDDHEIDDNYSPIDDRDKARFDENNDRFQAGLRAYQTYQSFSVPGDPPNFNAALREAHDLLDDYFVKDGFPFLIIDTRTHRERREAMNVDTARLITDDQWTAIKTCLKQSAPDKPLFICSPSLVLPRRLSTNESEPASALMSDAWDGYPAEFFSLLALLFQEQANNVVFISGDEHLSCLARFTVSCEDATDGKAPVRSCSIHSSPLYAPYPFANGQQEALREYDDFRFLAPGDGSTRYRCVAETTFAPNGDGFAVLQVRTDASGANQPPHRSWSLDVSFSRANGVYLMQL